MQETIKNELYYVLQRKECMNKLLLDTEQWRAKKIERYYDDEEQQINFEANAMNIFLRGIELFNALAKKLIGDFTVRMFTYLEENIGKQDTISLDHIAFLRQFLFSTTRLVKDPNVIEQILGSTKFTRQDLVLMSVNGEERKTMDYTGI